jgi:hypothetical protein|tara:strand:- start:304 stop:570 length:267 start_codon:yes stop_codon:yes gene_type:complete
MHIITVKGMKDEGAYAVLNPYGEKVVFLFQDRDDAKRYALMLEDNGDPEMDVIEVRDNVAIGACERTGTRYTVISPDDIVVPPPPSDT